MYLPAAQSAVLELEAPVITAEGARIVLLSILAQTRCEAIVFKNAHAVRGKETSTRSTFDMFAAPAFQDKAVNPLCPQ
jgi:hypothetical protein